MFVTHLCQHLPSTAFLHWSSDLYSLFNWTDLLLVFLSLGMDSPSLEGGCPEWPAHFHEPSKQPPMGSYLLFLWMSRSGLKSRVCRQFLAFVTPPQEAELCYLMVATAKAAVDCHIHNLLLLPCEKQEPSGHHPSPAGAVLVLRSYSMQPQKSRLAVPCCVALPPHVRGTEVAHKNCGLGGNRDLCVLAEQ